MSILNISAYKFVTLSEERLNSLRSYLLALALSYDLKGTILLSKEGINLMLAGEESQIQKYQHKLTHELEFNDLIYKVSYSETIPFKRMLVKIKKEIISFGRTDIDPAVSTAAYVTPQQLHDWYSAQHDMVIVDARNEYEIAEGKFADAINLHIDSFKEFPIRATKLLADLPKDKTLVTYCTGGVRCEKAGALLQQLGFKNVYQLEGGILNYFAKCGKAFYQGDCFVFDEREVV